MTRPTKEMDLRLYVILGPSSAAGRELADIAGQALAGGATILQVRDKRASTRDLLRATQAVMEAARAHAVPVIVNDRVDVALAAGAHGVHVGEGDLPVSAARRLMGREAIIGYSAGTPEAAVRAVRAGADYLGTGDVFGTLSKSDADPPIGLAGLAAVVAAVDVPVVAIGGVSVANAGAAVAAGAAGVAVISAVAGATNVQAAAAALRSRIDAALAK